MKTEIKVNLNEVRMIRKELSSLKEQVEERKVNVNFVNVKGNVAEEIINVAFNLNEIREAFITLIEKTEKIVISAENSFEDADAEVAEFFN